MSPWKNFKWDPVDMMCFNLYQIWTELGDMMCINLYQIWTELVDMMCIDMVAAPGGGHHTQTKCRTPNSLLYNFL